MIIYILFTFVYLSLIKVHNSIKHQLLERIQEKMTNGDYARFDLDKHHIIHIIKLNRSEVSIMRYDKKEGITKSEIIDLKEHLDENLNFTDSLKRAIIQRLYSFKDTGIKYMCISEEDYIYKNGKYLSNFLNNVTSYIGMIKNYEESKLDYLKYEFILRNSYVFSGCLYDKRLYYLTSFCEDYDKKFLSIVLYGKGNQLYFFKMNIDTLDMAEYFRYYYVNIKGVSEKDVDSLLIFVKNFNFGLHEIGFTSEIIYTASLSFSILKNRTISENVMLIRKIELEINEMWMTWNYICFSVTKPAYFNEKLMFVKISEIQLKEIKNFQSEINKINYNDLEIRNRLMNLLKGSKLYRSILNNILTNHDSGKGLILINILYGLAMITKSQFDEFIFNQNTKVIDINDIINQINCHFKSVKFSLYNLLLYSELESIANSHKDDFMFFKDFNYIISLSSVKKLMGQSNIDHLTVLERLLLFIDKIYYKPCFMTSGCFVRYSTDMLIFICQILSSRSIVDENIGLANTKNSFEEDYLPIIYDQIIRRSMSNIIY